MLKLEIGTPEESGIQGPGAIIRGLPVDIYLAPGDQIVLDMTEDGRLKGKSMRTGLNLFDVLVFRRISDMPAADQVQP